MRYTVYLSGEIHSDWRERIKAAVAEHQLPVEILTPNTDHASSDDCGDSLLGAESEAFWKDHKAAKLNSIRHLTAIKRADIVIVRFGEKYRQWNAAFDAGMAAALGKSLIVEHPAELTHPLKEIDAAAHAVAENTEQVIETLKYLCQDY
ncbi:YtoQ family protein [Marinobacterium arenosum]|uniref:YtoQ family protein n=1 Tax=Marinobacterium arenosum TaxID=2862496 RepID=UPI001C968CFE|nr:YtoQ family protein [Marinobacterium arenosum]MBY4677725.1 YtoQ family protein [Marinobacterium arenosum]